MKYTQWHDNNAKQMETFHASPCRSLSFFYDLLDVFISGLYNAIHLRPVKRRVMMLNLELCAELGDHGIIEIGTIMRNDSF